MIDAKAIRPVKRQLAHLGALFAAVIEGTQKGGTKGVAVTQTNGFFPVVSLSLMIEIESVNSCRLELWRRKDCRHYES